MGASDAPNLIMIAKQRKYYSPLHYACLWQQPYLCPKPNNDCKAEERLLFPLHYACLWQQHYLYMYSKIEYSWINQILRKQRHQLCIALGVFKWRMFCMSLQIIKPSYKSSYCYRVCEQFLFGLLMLSKWSLHVQEFIDLHCGTYSNFGIWLNFR